MYYSSLIAMLAVGVFGDGEVNFLSKPPNVEFRGHEECDSYTVKDVICLSMGLTVVHTNDWSGMYIKNAFDWAQAVAMIEVPGISSLDMIVGHKFPFKDDNNDIMPMIEDKMIEHYGGNQTMADIALEDDLRAAEITLNEGSLKMKRLNVKKMKEEEEEEMHVIRDISLWGAILDKLERKVVPVGSLPECYRFTMKSLHPLMDMYGKDADNVKEAVQYVKLNILRTKEVFDRVYKNKAVVLLITSDTAHTRRFRRAASEIVSDRNLAQTYDENYPVFFNIFLWFTIAFIMTIIATSMVTACMDPGRDSIIYRMTSTRMKKDN